MLADKSMFDIVILTDNRYVNPTTINWYIDQVLLEDQLLQTALVHLLADEISNLISSK